MALNQVIDLIVESGYIKDLQLKEAKFSSDQVKVIIRSKHFSLIKDLLQGYRVEDTIPSEIYQKGEYTYLNLVFPWSGNKKGGNIQTLEIMANKTVFSNKISIKNTENIFSLQGRGTDIISFILQMAENEQIFRYNFSVFNFLYNFF